ncbi:MAG: hypothetical protein ABWW65_03655 [Thermoprotei archaeon]
MCIITIDFYEEESFVEKILEFLVPIFNNIGYKVCGTRSDYNYTRVLMNKECNNVSASKCPDYVVVREYAGIAEGCDSVLVITREYTGENHRVIKVDEWDPVYLALLLSSMMGIPLDYVLSGIRDKRLEKMALMVYSRALRIPIGVRVNRVCLEEF